MSLKTFAQPFEKDGATFLVRGLTVGEYCELFLSRSMLGDDTMRVKDSFFVKVGLKCVVDWWDVPATRGGEPQYDENGSQIMIDFSEEMVENLPDEVLKHIGLFAWKEMTSLSEEEEEYLKGFIRFSDFLSDDKHKSQAEYYSCTKCVEHGKHITKPCGRSDKEIKQIRQGLKDDSDTDFSKEPDAIEAAKKEKRTKSLIDKMRTRKKQTRLSAPTEKMQEKSEKAGKLTLKKYTYPECPVSWIPDWVRVIGDKMLYCEKHNTNFFSGGLSDQPKKLYDISRITSNELAKIERESYEDKTKNNK